MSVAGQGESDVCEAAVHAHRCHTSQIGMGVECERSKPIHTSLTQSNHANSRGSVCRNSMQNNLSFSQSRSTNVALRLYSGQ